MAKTNLIYKKRKLEVDYDFKNENVIINKIKMIETDEDITNYVDNTNKQRLSYMIKNNESEWI